jgi:hypothetical protein
MLMSHRAMAGIFVLMLLVFAVGVAIVRAKDNALRRPWPHHRHSGRRHSDSSRGRSSHSGSTESGDYKARDAARLGLVPEEDEN